MPEAEKNLQEAHNIMVESDWPLTVRASNSFIAAFSVSKKVDEKKKYGNSEYQAYKKATQEVLEIARLLKTRLLETGIEDAATDTSVASRLRTARDCVKSGKPYKIDLKDI